MPNIKFNYLYRDGGNYKKFHSVVFGSDECISIEELELLIKSKLIDSEWFYAEQWKLPDLHFDTWENELDHTFHEFKSVEYCDEAATSEISLREFINIINSL